MIAFNAHFDGKLIIPDCPVDLPQDQELVVYVETSGQADVPGGGDSVAALEWMAENAVDDELSMDLSAQHDHYLYETPRRS